MMDAGCPTLVDERHGIGLKQPGPVESLMIRQAVEGHHYLGKYPDPRCMNLDYSVYLADRWVGCLVFGRPQAGKLYKGPFTYGSAEDAESGKARFCRWEVLNLARVWFSPAVQAGGDLCREGVLPGFHDRRGRWRSAFASTVIRAAIDRVRLDYLLMYPPVFFRLWRIKAVLSYCDTRLHRGTIYRASGFALAGTNRAGVETYAIEGLRGYSAEEESLIRHAGKHHPRSVKKRNAASFRPPPGFFGLS